MSNITAWLWECEGERYSMALPDTDAVVEYLALSHVLRPLVETGRAAARPIRIQEKEYRRIVGGARFESRRYDDFADAVGVGERVRNASARMTFSRFLALCAAIGQWKKGSSVLVILPAHCDRDGTQFSDKVIIDAQRHTCVLNCTVALASRVPLTMRQWASRQFLHKRNRGLGRLWRLVGPEPHRVAEDVRARWLRTTGWTPVKPLSVYDLAGGVRIPDLNGNIEMNDA